MGLVECKLNFKIDNIKRDFINSYLQDNYL